MATGPIGTERRRVKQFFPARLSVFTKTHLPHRPLGHRPSTLANRSLRLPNRPRRNPKHHRHPTASRHRFAELVAVTKTEPLDRVRLDRAWRNLVTEHLKLCLSAGGLNTPRALRADDATPAATVVSPLADNLARGKAGLRITAGCIQRRTGENRHFVCKQPLAARGIPKHTLDPTGERCVCEPNYLDGDSVHDMGRALLSAWFIVPVRDGLNQKSER